MPVFPNNQYANKSFLEDMMSYILSYSSVSNFVGTFTQTGTTITITETKSEALSIGALLIAPKSSIPVIIISGSGNSWVASVSQTVVSDDYRNGSATLNGQVLTLEVANPNLDFNSVITFNSKNMKIIDKINDTTFIVDSNNATTITAPYYDNAYTVKYTVENLFNAFLNGVSFYNYNNLLAVINYLEVSITSTIGSSPGCGLRMLATVDDGSVFLDTSKGASTNTFYNFNNKIKIALPSGNSYLNTKTNAITLTDAAVVTGSAGGNSINENHMTRPEILVALLSNSGNGYSSRFSTSIGGNNVYLAKRLGLSTEQPDGLFRLSVPSKLSLST